MPGMGRGYNFRPLYPHQISEIQRYFQGKYMLVMRDRKGTSLPSGTTYGEAIRLLLDI